MFQPALPQFQHPELLQQAFTHKSYCREHPMEELDNERLEFLGDAILDFLGAEFFYTQYPHKPEGELTALRAVLVSEAQLAEFANLLQIGQELRLTKGVEAASGRQNPNLLSSAFEALVGAYFLDCNSSIDIVRDYIYPFFQSVVDNLAQDVSKINYKSRLQEWSLATMGYLPTYTITDRLGPDHAPEFVADVWIVSQRYGQGKGRKKQAAEKAAAYAALVTLGLI